MGFYKFIEHQYGMHAMQLFKRFNNVCNQIYKNTLDRMFLVRCRKDKIIPNFIRYRTKNIFQGIVEEQYKNRTTSIINVTNKKILNMEIRMTMDRCKSKKKLLFLLRQSMYRLVPRHVVNEFINNQKRSEINNKQRIKARLDKKYEKLLNDNSLQIQLDPKWFINLTDKEVPSDVSKMLALGNKFAVPHRKKEIPLFNVVADVENVTRGVEDINMHNTIRSKAATIISNHMNMMDSCISREKLILQRMYDTTKTFLAENKDLMIVGADKSNVSIAIMKKDYEEKMDTHYKDKDMFRFLGTWDPTRLMQEKNNRIVRQLYKDKHLDKRKKGQLLIFTAQAPRPHATIKLHKVDRPVRIITNGINSPSYKMAKYINEICKSAIPSTQFNIRNSFELKEKLEVIQLNTSDIMVSFDIVSMFSTIPIDMVYRSLRKRWTQISMFTTIPWEAFEEMVKFCLVDTNYVQWKGYTYKQVDGLTIGGCTSAIMADFVITDVLEQVVDECGYDPVLLVKYVDDILIMMPREEVENTLYIFNSIHPSLKFTYELETNNNIPYLDLRIFRNTDGTLSTDFYQKPTSSDRLLNYKSSHPMVQKTSMVYGFISRVMMLSSTRFQEKNIMKIYTILGKNGYGKMLIDRLLTKFISRQRIPVQNNSEQLSPKYIGVGYVHHLTEKLTKLYARYDKKLKIGYKPSKRVDRIVKNDGIVTPVMEKHNVVYSIQCKNCDGVYIGQTGQKLKNRIRQHKADMKAKHIKINSTGAVQHSINTGHAFDFERTKVLETQPNMSKRLVIEALYINKCREKSVNLKSDMDNMNPVYTQLLHKL